MVRQLAADFARRVVSKSSDPREQIERVYWLAYSRPVSREEMKFSLAALARLNEVWFSGQSICRRSACSCPGVFLVMQVILCSAEFLYID